MSYRVFTLKAGQPVQVPVQGKVILVDDTGAAEGVDITPMRGGATFTKMPKRQKAFKCFADYDAIVLEAATDCVVSLFLSQTDVSLGFASGALVNVMGGVSVLNDPDNRVPVEASGAVTIINDAASRVPVDVGGAVIQVTATNVGINNTDDTAVPVAQKAGTEFKTREYQPALVTDSAPVAVTAAKTVLLAASAARRGFRVKNVGANPAAIGGTGITFANAVIVIQPGETWNENEAAPAAWWAICEAGMASTLNVQVIA